jgi:hypothetical protein
MKSFSNVRLLLLSFLTCTITLAWAYDPRNLLQKEATPQQIRESLLPKEQWIKYPAYKNREGWDKLTGNQKQKLIGDGEQYLNYKWQVITASDYLEYERTGNRRIMEVPLDENNKALSVLVFAELAEGKGRFMDQIINGVWHTCEMSSWVLSAHLTAQKSKRSLPDYKEQIIDLVSSDVGALLSWTWYFFRDEWDKINPVISSKVRKEVQERILEPYMQRSDYWWQALNYKPGRMVNNWNPWCNSDVLMCFLLLEDDKDKLAEAVYRTMTSVDQFINYVKEDGACEEGPSYWGHAAGKLYDYLQLLSDATNGKANIFDEPMIKSMGEYIVHSYVGNGWMVNFADAAANDGALSGRDQPNAALIFRYGKAIQSNAMQQFAAYRLSQKSDRNINVTSDFFRTIESLSLHSELEKVTPGLPSTNYTWYPQTQVCYMKNKQGFFVSSIGGHNDESHNHNDVGSFMLYVDNTPVFIDVGLGTYTRQTFSNERYSVWYTQSNYHNLPMINGVAQKPGERFKAKDVTFNSKQSVFSVNIAEAYGEEAAVKNWTRSYTLSAKGFDIDDDFQLAEIKEPTQLNFMTWARPSITKAGLVLLEKGDVHIALRYDAAQFEASVETIPLTDPRLSNVWGTELYRLQLKTKKQQLQGQYHFTINKY